jgi:two-component system, sensor histidine kinase RegB
MTEPVSAGQMHRDLQGEWVWLDTLTRLRWLAVSGQLAALLVAWFWLDLRFPLVLCLAVVAVSVVANLANRVLFPRSRRLSELELFATLLFDVAQLSLLLFLTGGLHNPFALLLLAPVTIAASTLPPRGALALGLVAMGLATLLLVTHQPLRLADGAPLLLPGLFLLAFWLALLTGIAFIGLYSHSVSRERHELSEALLATQMALAREQKLTDLGGVVAAAAHELGTPLATIKLVSNEMLAALEGQPELVEDARLIRDQAERCRQILRSMGRSGKADRQMGRVPLEVLVTEAAEPHADRGKAIELVLRALDGGAMPEVARRPEIIHGLRNLIQNAVDFAASRVRIEVEWSPARITLMIADDGPGFAPQVLARIGEPWLRDRRSPASTGRKGYEGMGMGLFIAKTLLERTGAQVGFANGDGASGGGARVRVQWARHDIETDRNQPLGENPVQDQRKEPERT